MFVLGLPPRDQTPPPSLGHCKNPGARPVRIRTLTLGRLGGVASFARIAKNTPRASAEVRGVVEYRKPVPFHCSSTGRGNSNFFIIILARWWASFRPVRPLKRGSRMKVLYDSDRIRYPLSKSTFHSPCDTLLIGAQPPPEKHCPIH